MNVAIARFFDIPEVADALGSHLAKCDVATLVRTCRQFRTLFEPWLYRDLTLRSSSAAKNGGLFRSTHSVRALSRNSHRVRTLSCWLLEAVYFFNCLLRYQAQITTSNINNSINSSNSNKNTAFVVDQPASTTSFTLPTWVPSPTDPPPHCRLTPLAPMSNLVHLRMNFEPPSYKIKPRYYMSTNRIATTTAARQACWIIQQSPHITNLQLDRLSVFSLKEMELLAVTFHGLRWLKEIRLAICADEEVWQRGFYKVFFALPVSVSVCKMIAESPLDWAHFWRDGCFRTCQLEDGEESELDMEDDYESSSSNNRQDTSDSRGSIVAIQGENQVGEEKDKELVSPEVFCRDEPLSQLKKFRAWDMSMLTNEEVLAVFDHCPNVDRLRMPLVSAIGEDLDILARSISERCPHLRRLSTKHPVAFVTTIMEAMSKQQQVEKVKVVYNNFDFGMGAIRRAFTRHSTTLRKLNFRCVPIRSKDLLAILELCESLEILIQRPGYYRSDHFITLADAISVPWACKRIRHLEIAIGLDQISLSSEDLPYYQRPAPVTLLEEETRQFADLEMLYREIGGLVHLEYLELHGTYTGD
ncbi:MAG: hypothetical protein J3R72DRAFT_444965, partial [Linnemannia gamsii]